MLLVLDSHLWQLISAYLLVTEFLCFMVPLSKLMKKEVNPAELDFLLRFPVTPNVTSPMDFISNAGWGAIKG